jgi:hypothetical protein
MSSVRYESFSKVSSNPWIGSRSNDALMASTGIKDNNIFRLCSEITDDPYWKNVLIEAYHNKFPKGISYKDGNIVYKNKEILIPETPEEAYIIIINFLKREYGIKSPMDIEREKYQEQEQRSKHVSKNSWKEHKSKNIKDLLITDYILNIKDEYLLTVEEFNELFTLINIAVGNNKIKNTDIDLQDGQIKCISNLTWDSEGRKFRLYQGKKITKKGTTSCAKKGATASAGNKDSIKKWTGYIKSFSSTIPYQTKGGNNFNNDVKQPTINNSTSILLPVTTIGSSSTFDYSLDYSSDDT